MRRCYFGFLFLIFTSHSYAQQVNRDTATTSADSTRHIKTLAPVMVYPYQTKEQIITPSQTLGGKRLQSLGSLSVADAVRYFSGTQLKDYGGIGGLKTLDVRAMGTNHVAVFYDGIQIGNAQNGQVDLGKFSLDNIESVSLYNAQKGSIFQPAQAFAAAASLYLESKTPVFEDHKRTNASVRFKTGSFGLVNPSLLWQQKISKQISSALSAELTEAHGQYKFRYTNGVYDTTAIRYNADVHSNRIEGSLYGIFRDSSTWKAQFYSYSSERGLPGAVVANHFQNYQRLWNADHFLQLSYKKKVNEWYQFLSNAKYSHAYTRYLDPFYQNIEGKLDNRFKESSLYFSLANQFAFTKNWNGVLSVDYKNQYLDANLYHFPYPTRRTLLAVAASEWQPGRFYFQGSVLGTFVNDIVKQYGGAGNKNEFTPSVNASWKPFADHQLYLRAFYKNVFRMPTFNDLYYTFIGNIRLRPEFAHQFNVGFSYSKFNAHKFAKSIYLTVDAYQNKVTDKIVALPGTNLFRWSMMNLGKVDIKGVDVVIKNDWVFSSSIELSTGINYTYQKALNVTPNWYNYKNQIPYIPVHSGSFTTSARYQLWNLNYSFIYTGERYSQSANIAANYVPAWYTHDVSLSKEIQFKKFNINLSGEVMNLANQYYDVVRNYPMPGRSYRISITIKI